MSVPGVSSIEIAFGIAAIVMTLLMGLVMLPAIRKALRETDDTREPGNAEASEGAPARKKKTVEP